MLGEIFSSKVLRVAAEEGKLEKVKLGTAGRKSVHELTFSESPGITLCLEETRAMHADREVRNVAMKQNCNMRVCGHQEESR